MGVVSEGDLSRNAVVPQERVQGFVVITQRSLWSYTDAKK